MQVGSIKLGINKLGDMIKNGGRDFTQKNKATQALIGFEEHKKAYFGNTAFGGTVGDKAFLRRGGIDLSEIFDRQDLLEARIGGSLNCCHKRHTSAHGSIN